MILAVLLLLGALQPGPRVTADEENIAAGAKAVQSSTGNDLGHAENAVDGNSDANARRGSCTYTKTEANPWWRVELPGVYNITSVTIVNRGDCCEERIHGAQIRIGNSLKNNGNKNKLVAVIRALNLGATRRYRFKATEGRFVNVFLPGEDKILTLCEVKVFSAEGSFHHHGNIALRAPALQSSSYNSASLATKAVDGNNDIDYRSGSCSHTKEEANPWWRVELPDVYNVTSVTITNRGDCCGNQINGAQIRVGNSLKNNGNDNTLVTVVEVLLDGATEMYSFKATEGRFINIFLPGEKKTLTLCEVKVFADEEIPDLSENIALGATVKQSSTTSSGRAENAVDGSTNTDYFKYSCTHTKEEDNPWWRVELPDLYNVTSVTITNRGDCCSNRIHGAQIRIGNSLKDNGNKNKLVALVGLLRAAATEMYRFNATEGQFVNIFLPGKGNILTLCEVKVFADVALSPPSLLE